MVSAGVKLCQNTLLFPAVALAPPTPGAPESRHERCPMRPGEMHTAAYRARLELFHVAPSPLVDQPGLHQLSQQPRAALARRPGAWLCLSRDRARGAASEFHTHFFSLSESESEYEEEEEEEEEEPAQETGGRLPTEEAEPAQETGGRVPTEEAQETEASSEDNSEETTTESATDSTDETEYSTGGRIDTTEAERGRNKEQPKFKSQYTNSQN